MTAGGTEGVAGVDGGWTRAVDEEHGSGKGWRCDED